MTKKRIVIQAGPVVLKNNFIFFPSNIYLYRKNDFAFSIFFLNLALYR